ncbi:hypothetical protein PgNI_11098 [Pyricularia grisea]|uniref:Uncharacterized protein n=1 Tax=Pyricularia grisea TaxID=148305 RepID=A0A6P8AYA3_PYRGI|nr:hypothetical protein PgNI_11098 [Pyricularia grisea]TLD07320.1 hypothetical protein PgNI_11098 [Pyricularia grisea]
MHFHPILATALSVVAPALAVPILSEVLTGANSGAMLAKRDTCANYRFMSLGQLDVENDVLWAMSINYSYDGINWTRINPGDDILVGGSRTFTRGDQLKLVQRDRNFYINMCNVLTGSCVVSPGVFQIPSAGKQQWVASILVKSVWDGGIQTQPFCEVGAQLPDATNP